MPAYGPVASYPIMAPESLFQGTPTPPPSGGNDRYGKISLGEVIAAQVSPQATLGGVIPGGLGG